MGASGSRRASANSAAAMPRTGLPLGARDRAALRVCWKPVESLGPFRACGENDLTNSKSPQGSREASQKGSAPSSP